MRMTWLLYKRSDVVVVNTDIVEGSDHVVTLIVVLSAIIVFSQMLYLYQMLMW